MPFFPSVRIGQCRKKHYDFPTVFGLYGKVLPSGSGIGVFATRRQYAAMESISAWVKAEIFMDFHVTEESPIEQEVAAYITFSNTARPAYSLKYLTPQQHKEAYAPKHFATGIRTGS